MVLELGHNWDRAQGQEQEPGDNMRCTWGWGYMGEMFEGSMGIGWKAPTSS